MSFYILSVLFSFISQNVFLAIFQTFITFQPKPACSDATKLIITQGVFPKDSQEPPQSAMTLHGQRKWKESVPDLAAGRRSGVKVDNANLCASVPGSRYIDSDSFYMDVVGLTYEDSVQLCRKPSEKH